MEVRLCHEGPERELVAEFCRRVFDVAPNARADAAVDSTLANPYDAGPPPTAIAIHDGAVVGHVTSTPFRLWVNGVERPAHWLSGIHVLPEYRGQGVARQLAACITNALPLVTGVARVAPSLRAFIATNWVWPGKIADHIHIVNPGAFLRQMSGERVERFVPRGFKTAADLALRLFRGPLQLGIRCWQRLRTVDAKLRHGAMIPFVEVANFERNIDALWEQEKSTFSLTHVRRADYLNWQFPVAKGWQKVVWTAPAGVRAWAIFAIMEYRDGGQLHGLKALNVVDALWDSGDPSTLDSLISYFLHRAYIAGVDITMFSGDRPDLRRALSAAAFIKLPSTIYAGFGSQDQSDNFTELFPGSYITRGYADAAGGLGPA